VPLPPPPPPRPPPPSLPAALPTSPRGRGGGVRGSSASSTARAAAAWADLSVSVLPLKVSSRAISTLPGNPPSWLRADGVQGTLRSEEHTSELQSLPTLLCPLLLHN